MSLKPSKDYHDYDYNYEYGDDLDGENNEMNRDQDDDDEGSEAQTAQKEDADSEEAEKRERKWMVKRRVITENMIKESIYTELCSEYHRLYVPSPDEIVVMDAAKLLLSFQNIDKISNLSGLRKLVRLQLDNNVIEKIENLDDLVNLEWLDLSFNFITVIEGLDKLTKLTDLSLCNNKISAIGNGLDNLVNLNVLSLGKNLISDIQDVVRLRNFKNLRALNLRDNPVCADDDYKVTVLAHLEQLKYLDYDYIEAKHKREAYDKKMDAINELRTAETAREQKLAQEKEEKRVLQILEKAKLVGLVNAFATMQRDDKEANVAKLMGVSRIAMEYERHAARFEEVVQEMKRVILSKTEAREKEEGTFKQVVKSIAEKNEKKQITIVETYTHLLKVAMKSRKLSALAAAKQSVEVMVDELMAIEAETKKAIVNNIEAFTDAYKKMTVDIDHYTTSMFRTLNELENKFNADIVRGINETSSNSGGSGEEITADKDGLLTCANSSHDNRLETLSKIEEGMKVVSEATIVEVNKAEIARNRKRVMEIYELGKRCLRTLEDEEKKLMR